MHLKIFKPTKLDIIFIQNYNNPAGNSLREFREDMEIIENLKRYVKNFYMKKNEISFKILFNNFMLISNIFHENSHGEILTYIAYKYFYNDPEIFDYYNNIVFYLFDMAIDSHKIKDEYLKELESFIQLN